MSSDGASDLKDKEMARVDEVPTPASGTVDDSHKTLTFPEGGFHAWCTVFGGFLVQFTQFGYINSFGVYQDYYVRIYLKGYTPSEIGWIGGVQVFFNFILGIVAGRLFDRGYFRHVMVLSIIFYALALFMLSLSHENQYYQVFLTNGVLMGLASGFTYVPSLGIVSHYFQQKRAAAVGIVSSGSALGAILHPIMLNKLFNNSIGFHNGVRISGAMNTFLLIVAFFLMRPRLPPKPAQNFPVKEWVVEPAYALALVTSTFTLFGLFFPVFYLQLQAISNGVERSIAFYALSILNAASFIGRVVPSAISRKTGVCNSLLFFIFATGVVTYTMPAVKNLTGTVLFAIFWGFCSGAQIALVPPAVALTFQDMREAGARLGIFFATGSIIGLFATPICGALLTREFKWLNAAMFAGSAFICSSIAFFFCRGIIVKRTGSQLV